LVFQGRLACRFFIKSFAKQRFPERADARFFECFMVLGIKKHRLMAVLLLLCFF
jgi:hypothetical protein